MLYRFLGCALLLVLAACTPSEAEPTAEPIEPRALLEQVIDHLRAVETFHMIVEQTGTPYVFSIIVDPNAPPVNASMPRADAQYRAPQTVDAQVRLRLMGGVPLQMIIFARGTEQWVQALGSDWFAYPIAPGFDPRALLEENSGFSRALNELRDLQQLETERLIDGTPIYHLRGEADGGTIEELLFNLVEIPQDDVQVDAFVERATLLPALIVVELPNTATEDTENTAWRIDLFDYNQPVDLVAPDAEAES